MESEVDTLQELGPQKESFVVVLGSGLEKRSGIVLPSLDEKARIMAALELIKESGAKHIVFTGGDVYRIGRTLSEISSEYSQKESLHGHISGQNIKIANISAQNTAEEIEKVANLQKANPAAHFTVISNKYHRVAQKLCQKYNLEFVSAEDKLKERYGKNFAIKIDAMMASGEYRALEAAQIKRARILGLPFGEFAYKIYDYFLKRRVALK